MSPRLPLAGLLATLLLLIGGGGAASAASSGVQRLHYRYGPIKITPGQNVIKTELNRLKPKVDGYITRFSPNLVRANGKVPPVDVIHLHHGVWANATPDNPFGGGLGGIELFAAAGEEKTVFNAPKGYGYHYRASDLWFLNHMLHNLQPSKDLVYITYDIDFVPDSSPAAKSMRRLHPVWMDVRRGELYPVFDVKKGSGKRGKFTYPTQAANAYPRGRQRNRWTAPEDMTLVQTAGHLHPGGLFTDLYATRGEDCRDTPATPASCPAPKRTHLFRSSAHYWEPAGAVSWDVAMTASKPDWRVAVRKGETLSTTATYDSKRASWYESMGIMVVYAAEGIVKGAKDPFRTKVDGRGRLTHGHLKENENHGGEAVGMPVAGSLLDGPMPTSPVGIRNFIYGQGDLNVTGRAGRPPVVKAGQALTFQNFDSSPNKADFDRGIFHTITACKAPCNRSTGVAYPLADASVEFDSGELGYGPRGGTAAANRATWSTPSNLRPGTYTYFCRVHPFMRGAFRVKK